MKALSVVVPSYNSEDYLDRCLETLLAGGEALEIIIVNDGSSDRTAEMADAYQAKHPTIVKVVHQENGGHGMAVNAGVAHATGRYIKIVDSDDWVNVEALRAILTLIEVKLTASPVDMIINNYVYEKVGVRKKKSVHYSGVLPTDRIFAWDEFDFPVGKYLLMHSIIYKTSLLKECQLQLPKHTFYVDNLYAFEPLTHVKKMYYLDVDLYRYFIGRDDQSVNEKIMTERIDQQLYVNRRMIDFYTAQTDLEQHMRKYMRQYLEIITSVSSVLLIKEGSPENVNKKNELWDYIRQENGALYEELRKSLLGYSVNLPGRTGRYTVIGAYRLLRKIYGFN